MPANCQWLILRGRTWYVRLTIPPSARTRFNGCTHLVRTLGTRDLRIARRLRHSAVDALRRQIDAARGVGTDQVTASGVLSSLRDLRSQPTRENANTLQTALDANEVEWFHGQRFEQKTRLKYRQSLKLVQEHLRGLGSVACLESVNVKVAVSFRKALVAQEVHIGTGDAHLSALRSRWAMLIAENILLPPNPWSGIVMPRPKRGQEEPRRPWQDEELIALFAGSPGQSLFDVMTILLCTGMRRENSCP